jgi:hypothetical protein
MDLREAVRKTIVMAYRLAANKNDGYVTLEIVENNDGEVGEIEVILVEASKAIEFLEKWDRNELDFFGINMFAEIPRVQYIMK